MGKNRKVTLRVSGLYLLPPSARRAGRIRSVCRRILHRGTGAAGEVNIVFLDRARMRTLNRRYLDRSHDTDVIAFAYTEDAGPRPGERPFGDIFISAYQARVQAAALGHDVLVEVLTLAAHGALHLLGYDDATPRGRDRMFRMQTAALRPLPRRRK
ncbi:MAG: rRNA maturation RNase YbeY [Elusimicrobiota bacterium]|jgi:probable rRNA maturation factor